MAAPKSSNALSIVLYSSSAWPSCRIMVRNVSHRSRGLLVSRSPSSLRCTLLPALPSPLSAPLACAFVYAYMPLRCRAVCCLTRDSLQSTKSSHSCKSLRYSSFTPDRLNGRRMRKDFLPTVFSCLSRSMGGKHGAFGGKTAKCASTPVPPNSLEHLRNVSSPCHSSSHCL